MLYASFSNFVLALAALASACSPPSNASSDFFEIGTDGPADPATLGYSINHFALLVANITAMRAFYGDVLGMRHVFTYKASPKFDITYMGYSHGGKNGTGYQTGDALLGEKNNIEGLLELVHPAGNASLTSSTINPNTFSHVGLIVPDIKKASDRMEQFQVPVIKRLGQEPIFGDEVSKAFGLSGNAADAMAALIGIKAFGFDQFLIVKDPEGNMVEVQQQEQVMP